MHEQRMEVADGLEDARQQMRGVDGRETAATVENLQPHLVVERAELAADEGREGEVPTVVGNAAEVSAELWRRLARARVRLAGGLDGAEGSHLRKGLLVVHRVPLPAQHRLVPAHEARYLQLSLVPLELPLLLLAHQHCLSEAEGSVVQGCSAHVAFGEHVRRHRLHDGVQLAHHLRDGAAVLRLLGDALLREAQQLLARVAILKSVHYELPQRIHVRFREDAGAVEHLRCLVGEDCDAAVQLALLHVLAVRKHRVREEDQLCRRARGVDEDRELREGVVDDGPVHGVIGLEVFEAGGDGLEGLDERDDVECTELNHFAVETAQSRLRHVENGGILAGGEEAGGVLVGANCAEEGNVARAGTALAGDGSDCHAADAALAHEEVGVLVHRLETRLLQQHGVDVQEGLGPDREADALLAALHAEVRRAAVLKQRLGGCPVVGRDGDGEGRLALLGEDVDALVKGLVLEELPHHLCVAAERGVVKGREATHLTHCGHVDGARARPLQELNQSRHLRRLAGEVQRSHALALAARVQVRVRLLQQPEAAPVARLGRDVHRRVFQAAVAHVGGQLQQHLHDARVAVRDGQVEGGLLLARLLLCAAQRQVEEGDHLLEQGRAPADGLAEAFALCAFCAERGHEVERVLAELVGGPRVGAQLHEELHNLQLSRGAGEEEGRVAVGVLLLQVLCELLLADARLQVREHALAAARRRAVQQRRTVAVTDEDGGQHVVLQVVERALQHPVDAHRVRSSEVECGVAHEVAHVDAVGVALREVLHNVELRSVGRHVHQRVAVRVLRRQQLWLPLAEELDVLQATSDGCRVRHRVAETVLSLHVCTAVEQNLQHLRRAHGGEVQRSVAGVAELAVLQQRWAGRHQLLHPCRIAQVDLPLELVSEPRVHHCCTHAGGDLLDVHAGLPRCNFEDGGDVHAVLGGGVAPGQVEGTAAVVVFQEQHVQVLAVLHQQLDSCLVAETGGQQERRVPLLIALAQ
mmetsp:Transcript_18328/g.70797  ORF Transcript_18328/g.70797 Transcript_18328/m.70797 type:complete len:983 (+) Transcript_18328:2033-4981(+)